MPKMTWVKNAIARSEVGMIDGSRKKIVFNKGATFDTLNDSDPYIARAIALGWIKVESEDGI